MERDNDKLERLLRRDALGAMDDNGFTARVMRALPAPSPSRAAARHPWLTPALVLGSTALGSALAWLFAPDSAGAVQGFFDLASRHLTPAAITALATTSALLVCAVILAAHTE